MRPRAALMLMGWMMSLGGEGTALARNLYSGGRGIPERGEGIVEQRGFHEARMVLQDFAQCVAKRRPAEVDDYLLGDHSDAETLHLRSKIMDEAPNCLDSNEIELLPSSLQGALADSPEEAAAFSRLMPSFGSCVQKSRTVSADRGNMRATIADNYYRLAASARQPAAITAGKN